MSQHTPQPTEQVTQQTVAPPAPVSVDQPVDLQRQPVDQNTEMTPSPEMAYRPFPGNTMEDEEQMQVLHQQQRNRLEITKAETNNPSAGNEDNIQSSQPHMAPSLRAESTEKSKKRSFFKRLFGLK
jgi:hypothetical protein